MIPNKILWYLGYNNLGLILEQERKHWLLKTDKKKQVQDKHTGDIFQGVLDNQGSDIYIESSKLPIKNDVVPSLAFVDAGANSIFSFDYASFPFSIGSKGLMFARITSINYPIDTTDNLKYKNYRIVFTQAKPITMVFGNSPYTSEVYSGQWLETTTPPIIQMMDDNGDYTIDVSLQLKDMTNTRFYYPLDENLQPFTIDSSAYLRYDSESINDDGYIGYPLFWFTSDQTKTGPTIELGTGGINTKNMRYMFFGNPGNAGSRYNAKAYVNVEGTTAYGATPDNTLPTNWEIHCSPISNEGFTDSDADFNMSIDLSSIVFYNKNTGETTPIPIASGENENNVFTMSRNVGWKYLSNTAYKIDMDNFISNNENQSGKKSPLISIFEVSLDSNVPFYSDQTKNIGMAGIRMSASNPSSDVYGRYPHDLDKWDGLPSWFADMPETGVPQHLVVYAIHNTPMYSEGIPDSRQVAALLLDPGKMKTTDDEELTNDEIGRVYVLSNDDPVYMNNANAKYPKPARTVARICDIPTSVSDFLDVDGLVPVAIVDPDYVRSEASFTTEQKDILWNKLASKVVTPEALDESGNPFYVAEGSTREPYPYIWYKKSNLDKVDLLGHNDFREWVNLNPTVDPSTISVVSIVNGGSGYEQNSTGIIVIGGVSLNYVVNAVDANGGATNVSVYPQDNNQRINLSNFNMDEGNTGRTLVYGTMSKPRTEDGVVIPKQGEGLQVILMIENYAQIRTQQGNIYDDLVAFVYEDDGLMMYRYVNQNDKPFHQGEWKFPMRVTSFQKSTSDKSRGGYSITDALTRSILPFFQDINVCYETNGRERTAIGAMVTTSFINIIDTEHTPIHLIGESTDLLKHVDLCKFHCDALSKWTELRSKSEDAVMEFIKSAVNLDRDCYLIWQWRKPGSSSDNYFRYGIVRRSLNNYVTTDTTTTIPPTSLKYDSYINTNAGTTVVWDVPEFGPMMWVYNPNYKRHEIYSIDPETRDMYISYTNEESDKENMMSWDDVDIRISDYGKEVVTMVDKESGKLNFYVYTNNPTQSKANISNGLYTEYDFTKIASQGDIASETKFNPIGNWQLVFPRINQYKIVSDSIQKGVYHTETKLKRLIPIKGDSLGNVETVLDPSGRNINSKVVLFDNGVSGTKMKVFNPESGQFETV